MTAIAVTGAAGSVGGLVLEALESEAGIRRVAAIDVRPPSVATRNMEFYRADIRSSLLEDVLAGCDAVICLARSSSSTPAEDRRDVDVRGARNTAAAALRAGVQRVVYVSSCLVYGAHPDNDVPLTEVSPVRPLPDLPESAHPAEAEEAITGVLAGTGVELTILRAAPTLGRSGSGRAARSMSAPVLLAVEGYAPPVQVLHEDDLVRVCVAAGRSGLPGTYNVAADGSVPAERAAALVGRRRLAVRYDTAQRILRYGEQTGLHVLPASALPLLLHPTVMSCLSLREAGLAPRHGNEATLADAAAARRGIVSVGRLRVRPLRAAGVTAAAVGGSVVLRELLRRPRATGRTG